MVGTQKPFSSRKSNALDDTGDLLGRWSALRHCDIHGRGSFFHRKLGSGPSVRKAICEDFGIAPGGRTPIPGRFQIGSGGLPTHPGLLLDAPQGPSEPAQGYDCCFFASLKTLLTPTKATALRRNQRPRASFPLAGFEVTLIGRFWVTPEAS